MNGHFFYARFWMFPLGNPGILRVNPTADLAAFSSPLKQKTHDELVRAAASNFSVKN